jgi:hypothetical protein
MPLTPRPGELPAEVTGVVGRHAELASLHDPELLPHTIAAAHR